MQFKLHTSTRNNAKNRVNLKKETDSSFIVIILRNVSNDGKNFPVNWNTALPSQYKYPLMYISV